MKRIEAKLKYKCWWIFFHDWDKWEGYELMVTGYLSGRLTHIKYRQRRACKACGRTQDRHVSTVSVV